MGDATVVAAVATANVVATAAKISTALESTANANPRLSNSKKEQEELQLQGTTKALMPLHKSTQPAVVADSRLLPATTDPFVAKDMLVANLLVMKPQAIHLCFRNFLCLYSCLSILFLFLLYSCLSSYCLDFLYSFDCSLYSSQSPIAGYVQHYYYSSSNGSFGCDTNQDIYCCCIDAGNSSYCIPKSSTTTTTTTATTTTTTNNTTTTARNYCSHSCEILPLLRLYKEQMANSEEALTFS